MAACNSGWSIGWGLRHARAFDEGRLAMGPRVTDIDDSTPEDVAALYAWADLTGAKYRDYSAERREHRARMRLRAAKQALERELNAQREAAGKGAEAAGERLAEARRSEAVARAALLAIQEEREIAEARESARRKHEVFEKAEQLRRERTGPQPEAARPEAREHERTERAARQETKQSEAESSVTEAEAALSSDAGALPMAIRPAWLESAAGMLLPREDVEAPAPAIAPQAARTSAAAATLLDSRAEVASRWPVLQALMAQMRTQRPVATARMSWPRGPVTAIVSPTAGAGRTSLAAGLARGLAHAGERVLLVETVADGLLPYYFPAADDEGRTAAREGEQGRVSLFVLDLAGAEQKKPAQERIIGRLLDRARGCDRVVINVAPGAVWMVQGLAALRPMVLAAIAPEMSSVAGLGGMEQAFAAICDREGRALAPFYVLNRLDVGLPLHLDIREVLRRELGERLLTPMVRRSAAVGEALAAGTTVLDYAPDSPVTRDYAEVASWLRSVSAASPEAIAGAARGPR